MYESYFGFKEKPFSVAPDPRFVFLSSTHEEALAHLSYGVREGSGFVVLTGEVGTGKTTLLRMLLDQLPDNIDVAMILNPRLTPIELVGAVCEELKIVRGRTGETLKILVDRLNTHLLETFAKGRRTVLIIDEAQALGVDILEQIRLLTNLETTREKLLEIILVGQPELRYTLARHDLRQLAQRVTARYHLMPLGRDEVGSYVQHRLEVAGYQGRLFSSHGIRALARVTGGIPRLINEVGDRCLLGAYAEERTLVTRGLVRRAARQVLGNVKARPPVLAWIASPLMVLVLVAGVGWLLGWQVPRWSDVLISMGLSSIASDSAQTPVVVKIESPTLAKTSDATTVQAPSLEPVAADLSKPAAGEQVLAPVALPDKSKTSETDLGLAVVPKLIEEVPGQRIQESIIAGRPASVMINPDTRRPADGSMESTPTQPTLLPHETTLPQESALGKSLQSGISGKKITESPKPEKPKQKDPEAKRLAETYSIAVKEKLALSVDPTAPPPPKKSSVESPSGWVVQVGSFAKRRNAEQTLEKLRGYSYESFMEEVIAGSESLYRVRVGPMAEKKRAESIKEEVAGLMNLRGQVLRYP